MLVIVGVGGVVGVVGVGAVDVVGVGNVVDGVSVVWRRIAARSILYPTSIKCCKSGFFDFERNHCSSAPPHPLLAVAIGGYPTLPTQLKLLATNLRSISLSLSLCMCVCAYLPLYLFTLSLPLCVCVFISHYLSLFLSLNLYLCVSSSRSLYLSMYVGECVCASVCLYPHATRILPPLPPG